MSRMTPQQERTRERFESAIGLMAPVLDAMLALGDRVSRRFVPPSSGPEGFPIRALDPPPGQRPSGGHEDG
jgi:hypothetical protein